MEGGSVAAACASGMARADTAATRRSITDLRSRSGDIAIFMAESPYFVKRGPRPDALFLRARREIRETVPDLEFATHTLPPANAMPRGFTPTRTRRSTFPLEGSTRRASPRSYIATQSDDPSNATPWAPVPIVNFPATSPVAGSRRQRLSVR